MLQSKFVSPFIRYLGRSYFSTAVSTAAEESGESSVSTPKSNLKDEDVFSAMQYRISRAAQYTKIPASWVEYYKTCQTIIKFQLPLLDKDNNLRQIDSYLVQHNIWKLPTKGGLRIYENVTQKDLEAIAIQNAIKSALFDIPFGGSKHGICIDPDSISKKQLELLIRNFTINLAKKNMIGSSINLPAPALGTSDKEMNWIQDTYQTFFGQEDVNALACCVGKSQQLAGIQSQYSFTGYSTYFGLKTLFETAKYYQFYNLEPGLKGKTIILQGLGQVGQSVAHYLHANGAKIIGVNTSDGSFFNENGIDVPQLIQYYKKNQSLKNFSGAKQIAEDDSVLYMKCDVLIPCFKECTINLSNVNKIQCKIVAEGANSPITPQAGEVLYKKKIFVAPDIFINAGGVLSAYFEWIKNLNHADLGLLTRRWEEKSKMRLLEAIQNMTGLKVLKGLKKSHNEWLSGANELDLVQSGIEFSMIEVLENVYQIQTSNKEISFRSACYKLALEKIHQHYVSAGIPFAK